MSLQQQQGQQQHPLIQAARSGNEQAVRWALLANKSSIKTADSSGTTALHEAAACGHAGIVQLLLEAGATFFQSDTHGQTPLHLAAKAGDRKAELLLMQVSME